MTEQQTPKPDEAIGRDRNAESSPDDSGHSTADSHEARNREDESPG